MRREKLKRYLEVFGQLRGRGWSSWSVVNFLQGEDEEELMRKVSPTPSGGLSPNFKKRKCSPSKEQLELCLTNLEKQVDSLTCLVEEEEREGLLDKKERLGEVDRRLQAVLQRL